MALSRRVARSRGLWWACANRSSRDRGPPIRRFACGRVGQGRAGYGGPAQTGQAATAGSYRYGGLLVVGWDKVAGYGGPAKPVKPRPQAHRYGGLLVVGWDKVCAGYGGPADRSSRDRRPTDTAVCLW